VRRLFVPDRDRLVKVIRDHLRENDLGDEFYKLCLRELDKIDLKEFTELDARRIIKHFLDMWGQIPQATRRVDWERLAEVIRRNANRLVMFKNMDLGDVGDEEFERYVGEVKECYSKIRGVMGPTSTAKTLHIIAPRFLPLWDRCIRKAYEVPDSPKGYIKFMRKIREYWLNNESINRILRELERKTGLSRIRLIDIYNWRILSEQP